MLYFVKGHTSLSAVSPSLKILNGLCLDDLHMLLKAGNVQSGLQHLLLLQKDLQPKKGFQPTSIPRQLPSDSLCVHLLA